MTLSWAFPAQQSEDHNKHPDHRRIKRRTDYERALAKQAFGLVTQSRFGKIALVEFEKCRRWINWRTPDCLALRDGLPPEGRERGFICEVRP
jgi:hypothetical protein